MDNLVYSPGQNTLPGAGTVMQPGASAGTASAPASVQASVMAGEILGAALLAAAQKKAIGEEEIHDALKTLSDYKSGKANLESRVVEDELWYQLQHWEVIRRAKRTTDASPEPTSAWLFDALSNKHADAMDNFPEPNVLPRERNDEEQAHILSEILPVVFEHNDFEQTYSDNWWEKLKHGTAAYGVFWNTGLENGLGDIDIRRIDLLNIFWEPGIEDIQKSRNLFILDLVDNDVLEKTYPQLSGKLGGAAIDIKQYIYDDTVDTANKSVVVDWYYKRCLPSGKTVLHYVKFVGETLLFASENEPQYRNRGWYDHGSYPIVFDTLFPEKGTPVGFGYVAITKDPQLYIDKLSANILQSSMMATKPRFFVTNNTGVNETEFLDWSKPLIHVEGSSLDEARLRQLNVNGVDGIYLDVLQMKINELKETAANRDFNNGGTSSGVTAAAAIAALQEAGNKTSRDMIAAAYRAYTKLNYLCIELIRQFYDETRSFRITGGAGGGYSYVDFNNSGIVDQPMSPAYPGQEAEPGYEASRRHPIFDIKIKAQKKNPFSQMSQNELAKELYSMGFFLPEKAQEASVALGLMEFEGKEAILEQIRQGQTLLNLLNQANARLAQMAAVLPQISALQAGAKGDGGGTAKQAAGSGNSLGSSVRNAQGGTSTPYMQALAERSQPDMSRQNGMALGEQNMG